MRLLHQQPAHQRTAAFGLTEVLVAFVLVGVMFLSLYAGISSGFSLIGSARENLRATQVLLEKMETVRMYSWDQINSNGYVPPAFTAPFYPNLGAASNSVGIVFYGTTLITNAVVDPAYSNQMREVIVNLNWTNKNVGHSREMRTYISQYGMQRYIY
jgi:Tfp pilus assembly protein PilV